MKTRLGPCIPLARALLLLLLSPNRLALERLAFPVHPATHVRHPVARSANFLLLPAAAPPRPYALYPPDKLFLACLSAQLLLPPPTG